MGLEGILNFRSGDQSLHEKYFEFLNILLAMKTFALITVLQFCNFRQVFSHDFGLVKQTLVLEKLTFWKLSKT